LKLANLALVVGLDVAGDEAAVCCEHVIVEIGRPDQRAREAECVSPIDLLLEGIGVIIRNPLVSAVLEVLDGRILVLQDLDTVIALLDLDAAAIDSAP